MHTRSAIAFLRSSALGALLACGGASYSSPSGTPPAPNPTPAPTTAGPVITIRGMAYDPVSLSVTPGSVVTVHNLDTMTHSVTSESAPGTYRPGAVGGVSFDTGLFQGTAAFTVPANAAVGTVIPYYCTAHLGSMATPNGEIRVVATTSGTAPTSPASPAPMPASPY